MENAPLVKQDDEYKKYILKKVDEFNNNDKKTALLFCDTFFPCMDGVIVVIDNYATKLSKYYNVVVVVPKHHGFVSNQPDYLVVGVSSMFFKFVNYDLAFPNCDNFVKKVLKMLKIDIIHSHSPFTMGKFAIKIAKKRNVPLVMTMHSQYKQDFEKYVKSKPIVNTMVKSITKVFNKATEVWTMHELVANVLKGYGYKGRFFYMPNACSLAVPTDRKKLVEDFNKLYNIDENMPVLFFLGRIVEQKNIFFIVDALKILDDKNIDFRMFFIGGGPDQDRLQKHIDKLNLSSKVTLMGRVDDRELQAKFYQRADLFLFPSKYDTSSIVQIEAALHQTPGVYLKGTATAQTITDHVNGYLSDDNVETYAQTIIDALSNKDELKKISQNALEQLYVNYDMLGERAHERYEFLMDEFKSNQP